MTQSVRTISATLEKETGIKGVYDAWANFRPVSFKVDLWRAVILWERGGIYMDADVALLAPLDWFVDVEHDAYSICTSHHDVMMRKVVLILPPQQVAMYTICAILPFYGVQ
jgi:mannosyltransferase OCH1-like enzyme